MSINAAHATGPIAFRGFSHAPGATTTDPPQSLLPTPKNSAGSDPLAQLYAFLIAQENQQSTSDTNSVTQQQAQRKSDIAAEGKAFEEEQKAKDEGHGFLGAIEKFIGDVASDAVHLRVADMASDAKSDLTKGMIDNPHFWDDFGKIAKTVGEIYAIVGGAALTVVTGGAGAAVVAVGVALSVSAMADQQFHILHALGVSDKVASLADLGMAVVGSVLTMGPGVSAAAGATAASTGVNAATSTATTAASASANEFGHAATVASTGLQVVAAGATGTSQIQQAAADAKATDAQADELSAQQATEKTDRVLAWLMTQLEDGKKSFDKTKQTVQSAIETRDSTSLALASFGKA